MILQDCDYILDKKQRFFMVRNDGNRVYCNLVFKPDKNGDRFNKLLKKNYSKHILKYPANFYLIEKKDIKGIFKPRAYFRKNYKNLSNIWKKIPDSLIKIGIDKKNIGIFGSNLIGFDSKKDVDFVIYGKENCLKIMKNINYIRSFVGSKKISKEHIKYQDKKYKLSFSEKNDFTNLLKNKWSSLQISKGVLTTIRFVYYKNEQPKDVKIKRGSKKIIEGMVIEDFGTNFIPRIFYLRNKTLGEIRVLSYFWVYQSCVKKGQKIRVFGEYKHENKTLYLSKKDHWIKIIKN